CHRIINLNHGHPTPSHLPPCGTLGENGFLRPFFPGVGDSGTLSDPGFHGTLTGLGTPQVVAYSAFVKDIG
ncbi:MAG: hypothetical protein ACK53Y_03790, partial [bacterium]